MVYTVEPAKSIPAIPEPPIDTAITESDVTIDEREQTYQTWWSYLGLGGATGNGAIPQNMNTVTSDHSVTQAGAPDGQATVKDTPKTDVDQQQSTENHGCEGSPMSTTATPASEHVWYNPWRLYDWYAQSSTPHGALNTTDEPGVNADPDQVSPPIIDTSKPVSLAPSEMLNPITVSFTTNSKGWTTFFSSRQLSTKMISEHGEPGMEVMDIDDDELGPSGKVGPLLVPIASSGSLRKTEKSADTGANGNGNAPSIRSIASTSSKGKDTPMGGTTLTSPDNMRRKISVANSKRPASPAPSQKSFTPHPRPPNLVLPTFNDTFRSLPRSRPPPCESTTSTLMKTWGYVNSLLLYGAGTTSAGSVKGKGKGHSGHLEGFGKELPRAWDVVGEIELPLSGCRNVVVIGVHGWFPGASIFA